MMTPEMFSVFLLAASGLAIGSFLNVCIYRLPRGESLVLPPSRCVQCEREIAWYDNVPVLGWVKLGGRCRFCGQRISPIYPIVEASTAALFLLHYWYIGWQPLLIPRLVFTAAMMALFVIDLQHRILPNVITLPGIVAGFLFGLFLPPGWQASLIGILVGGGILFVVAEAYYRIRNEEGLGMGDVKMLAMIGAFLGWKLCLLTLVLSSILGSVIGAAVIMTGKGDMKYALPFGTFLAVAAIAASLIGDSLLEWYLSFY